MKKLIASFALALGLVAGTTFASAPAATAATTSGKCTTWQYKVTEKTSIYDDGYLTWVGFAYKGYYVNARFDGINIGGTKYKIGSVYDANKQQVWPFGWVNKSKLKYITCW